MGNQHGSATKATEANQRSNTSASRQPMSPSSAVGHPLLQLQQVIGNQAVGRVIQTRLNVSQPGDQYEQEADQTAEMVMRMPDGEAPGIFRSSTQIQRQCSDCASGGGICPKCAEESSLQRKPLAGTIAPIIQRRCNECEEEETLHLKQSPGHPQEITPAIATNINALRSGGQPLSPSVRAFFEPRFGYDFSDVRVHTTDRAAETARQLSAQAFTVGRDIVFGAGQYRPETSIGRLLLAHELTHVAQQANYGRSSISTNKPTLLKPDSLWSKTKEVAMRSYHNAIPRLRSGLRPSLFACKGGGGGGGEKECDKNATCKDICDKANSDSTLKEGGGGVICCHDKKCPCVFDLPAINYKRGDCDEYERIAELHEQRHLSDVDCDSSKGLHRPPFKDPSKATSSECAHRKETTDLLNEAIKKASEPCKTKMTGLRDLLDTWVKANCGTTGSGGSSGSGGSAGSGGK